MSKFWLDIADVAATQLSQRPLVDSSHWKAVIPALSELGVQARAALKRIRPGELEAIQCFSRTPPSSCGALLVAAGELVGKAWDSADLLHALEGFTEQSFSPSSMSLVQFEHHEIVRLRSALNGVGYAGDSLLSEKRAAEAHSFAGLFRTVRSVAYLHDFLAAVLSASMSAQAAYRSMLITQRAALLALLGTTTSVAGLTTEGMTEGQSTAARRRRDAARTQLIRYDPALVAEGGDSVTELRATLLRVPYVTEGLLHGRHACALRTRPIREAVPSGASAPSPAAGVLSRRDLIGAVSGSDFGQGLAIGT